jgi:mannose-6-phosphate isomerase-like protein (cupin superfamily)
MSAQLKEMNMTAAERANSNRSFKQKRVWNMAEEFARVEAFREIAMTGGTKPPVAFRTPGKGAIKGNTFIKRAEVPSVLHVQCAYIEPGNRKYLHWHENAETVWVIIEGEGEFYGGPNEEDVYPVKAGDIAHALPGQWHGMGNTGKVPLKYLSIEGPQPVGGAFDKTTVAE